MSTHDLFGTIAPEFDAPVMPRAEFASALWRRLDGELRPSPAPRVVVTRRRSWLALVTRPRRMALVAAVLLLLLSGVATATYLSVRTWVSGSGRGAQVTSDFRLSTAFTSSSSDPSWYWATALSADGHDLYLADGTNVFRVSGIDADKPSAPIRDVRFASVSSRIAWHGLAPSPGGDLFALSSEPWGSAPLSASVVVARPDGTHQVVITYRELRRRGLLPGRVRARHGWQPRTQDDGSFAIAAPARDRLLVLAAMNRSTRASNSPPFPLTSYLIEVVDPNGDGDWSDHTARRIALPRSLAGFGDRDPGYWWFSPVAEPSLQGDDPSSAILLAAHWAGASSTGSGAFRVYRVDDVNGDGDALDQGEVERVHADGPGNVSWLAERIDRSSGRPRRELVLTGGSHLDQISLVDEDGRVTDIGRSFPGGFDDVHTAPNGDIYAVVEGVGRDRNRTRVYRLSESPSSAPRAPEPRPAAMSLPPAGSSPLLFVSQDGQGSSSPTSSWVRPDGSRLGTTTRAQSVCPAETGGAVAFASDVTVPREPFVYVSTPGSPIARKVTELPMTPACPFDGRHLVLASAAWTTGEGLWTLEAYDLRRHRLRRIVDSTPRFALAPDAHRIAYVRRAAGRDALIVLDLRTLRRHRLGTVPHTEGELVWAPDGRRIAVVSGRRLRRWELKRLDDGLLVPPHRHTVALVDVRGSRAVRTTSVLGGIPTVKWSPDGTKLLVCSTDHATGPNGPATGCEGSAGWTSRGIENFSVLRVMSATGAPRSRLVTHGTVTFAGWSPKGGFAWADFSQLHLPNGRTMRLDTYGGGWVGWSSDGRYLAQGSEDGYRVIDLKTGRQRKLLASSRAQNASVRWWR